jgi:hypothetical protein
MQNAEETMANKKSKMVTAIFRDRLNAQGAYDMLRNRGYQDSEINVLMSDKTKAAYLAERTEEQGKVKAGTMAVEGMGVGGAVGTAVGAGLAAGLTLTGVIAAGTTIILPGLNLLIAGPLAAVALAGGGAGAVAGGVIGALVGAGIPEDNARAYHEALREGGVVLGVVPRSGEEANKIQEEFENFQGEDVCYC